MSIFDSLAKRAQSATGGQYAKISDKAKMETNDYLGHVKKYGHPAENKLVARGAELGRNFHAGNQNVAMDRGMSVLGMMGRDSVQGAALGGGIGGAIEAAQGGSFWDGAKEGAFKGAGGLTAYRYAKRGSGATSTFGGGGIAQSSKNLWNVGNYNNPEVSKQAAALLTQRQRDNMARATMNSYKK